MRRLPARQQVVLLAVCLLQGVAAARSPEELFDLLPGCIPGEASIGFYYGSSPLDLRQIDLFGLEAPDAWPVANPVMSGERAPPELSVDSVSKPFLFQREERLYMFYEARSCLTGLDSVAVAKSTDGGATFRSLGVVLGGGSHIGAPFVFEHEGEVYMLPDNPREKQAQLWRTKHFPNRWQRDEVLVDAPLRGVSLVQHAGEWWLLGYRRGAGLGGQEHVLAVYRSKGGALGPYKEIPSSPIAVEGAVSAGRVFAREGGLYRFGRSCVRGECGSVEAYKLSLSKEGLDQHPVKLHLGPQLWRQQASWDSAGHVHVDVLQLEDGTWSAAVEGRQLEHSFPTSQRWLMTLMALCKAVAFTTFLAVALVTLATLPEAHAWLRARPWGQVFLSVVQPQPCARSGSGSSAAADSSPAKAVPYMSVLQLDEDGAGGGAPKNGRGRPGGSTMQHRRNGSATANGGGSARSGSPRGSLAIQRLCQRLSGVVPERLQGLPWAVIGAGALLVLAVCGASAGAFARTLLAPYWVQPEPIAIGGHFSRFTLMVMSYEARLPSLQLFVRHYSQCPSVGEVLVVWNKGVPPDPHAAFHSAVPVRVRAEPTNSMNNRFQPDSHIRFRGVLSLDDDIMLPCSTIEGAFALWRQDPSRIVGFYPRLLEPEGEDPGAPPVFHTEAETLGKGRYNAILAGAAFLDSATLFPAYWQEALAPARRLVDEVFNCDDLLLNFVAANITAAAPGTAPHKAADGGEGSGGGGGVPPSVQWVRPERRVDVSKLSGVGISHDFKRFRREANLCLSKFAALFGGSPLRSRPFEWSLGGPPNCDLGPLGCIYL